MDKINKLILMTFALLLSLSFANAADNYVSYQFNFPSEQPQSIFIDGGVCTDALCSGIDTTRSISIYDTALLNTCDTTQPTNAGFNTCLANTAKLTGNIIDLTNRNSITIKFDSTANFGSEVVFSPSNDSYILKSSLISNTICNTAICIDPNVRILNFNKLANAQATISNLNILNVNNVNAPIQIEVPVSVSQTVSSAYQLANPGSWIPSIPAGYSDILAKTNISIVISEEATGNVLFTDNKIMNITADTATNLGAFSYQPTASLLEKNLKFTVTTNVIDNQVSSSIPDFATHIAMVYPINLDGSCWSNIIDFSLVNDVNVPINPANTQILAIPQLGVFEQAFAQFTVNSFTGSAITPIGFEAILSINGIEFSRNTYSSSAQGNKILVDLSTQISNLAIGSNEVKLQIVPIGQNCVISSPVTQIQNLEITPAPTSNLTILVSDVNGNPLENSIVNVNLLSLDGVFANNALAFTAQALTDINGNANFVNLYNGNYNYDASLLTYTTSSGNLNVLSNTNLNVVLNKANIAPVIVLPTNLESSFDVPLVLDLSQYVSDANDAFNTLSLLSAVTNGPATSNIDANGILTVTASSSGIVDVLVTVTDSSGASAMDSIKIIFAQNLAPVINSFTSDIISGNAPLGVTFNASIDPIDGDVLTCVLDFGDGLTSLNSCNINAITHTYGVVGNYTAILTVTDNVNPIVISTIDISVLPIILSNNLNQIASFTSNVSSGLSPLNVKFNFSLTNNTAASCYIMFGDGSLVSNTSDCFNSLNGVSHTYNAVGTYFPILVLVRPDGSTVSSTLTISVLNVQAPLSSVAVANVKQIVNPENFKVNVSILPNSNLRDIRVSSTIICRGISNNLKEVSLDSLKSISGNIYQVDFTSQLFELKIPTNENCLVSVDLKDNFGKVSNYNSTVIFQYPQIRNLGVQSIRGVGTEALNVLSSTLKNNLRTGFNEFNFNLVNNEAISKAVTISVSSNQLGINSKVEESLAAGVSKDINININVRKDIKPGFYPVRVSYSDGTKLHTRYVNLKIN